MSAADALLIFLDQHIEVEGWLQLRDGDIVARGSGADDLPRAADPEDGDPIRQVAVVPGDSVTLHWLEVPGGLAPAQAAAAARLMAAEVSAQPLGDMHVAVGPENEDAAERAVALVPALTMAGWIGALQSRGVDPDLLLPEPLLLPRPDEGFVRYDRAEKPLIRGVADAFSVEPDLADLVVAGAPVRTIADPDYEAGLADAIAAPAVNLRQGPFAKRRRWQIDWVVVRRLAMLGLAILLASLAIEVVSILRYTYAADALETETRQIVAQVLPGSESVADPRARMTQRLTDLRGGGAGYGAIVSALYAAVNATPNVEISSLSYDRDGSLTAAIQSDSVATLSAVQQRIDASGFAATLSNQRMGGGRQMADLIVRQR